MSSITVFLFGIMSLSLSAIATFRISKRRAQNKVETTRRPLILPWLVSGDLVDRPLPTGHSAKSPVIITIQSNAPRQRYHSWCPELRAAQWRPESLPPYIDQPMMAADASFQNKKPLEKNAFGRPVPIGAFPNLPVLGDTKSPVSHLAATDIEPIVGTDHEQATDISASSQADPNADTSDSTIISSWGSQLRRGEESFFSNRNSVSSVATSVDSRCRDSTYDLDGFQKLGVVIGSGLRLQAHYGFLSTTPRSQHQIPVLTPIGNLSPVDGECHSTCELERSVQPKQSTPPESPPLAAYLDKY